MNISIRNATENDAGAMWELIHELAIFERSGHEHTVGKGQLREDIKSGIFKAFVAEVAGEIAGMALLYPIYSTWKGRSWYLEDIIVKEENRRMGIGTQLFEKVLEFSRDEKAGRLGWQVLNWNEPAIKMYQKYNAVMDDEWITCRLTQEQLHELAKIKNESI